MKRKSFSTPITSKWRTFTPTGSWTTNTTYTGRWRRDGQELVVQVKVSTSGAPDATGLTLNMPNAYTIDTALLIDGGTAFEAVGSGGGNDSGTAYKIYVAAASSTTVQLRYQSATSGATSQVTNTTPFTFGATDYVTCMFRVPIVGWEANRRIF